jgi:S-(hydroxymethyl)glutathione dehydrogenase/alcohol dehydrogenase
MRAAVQHQIGQDKLEVFDDVEAVGFGPGKVRVRVRATGLCHSDLCAMSGVLPQPAPFIPGHEGAGEIAEVGEGVDGLAVGDRVLVCWLPACGACPACRRGQSHLCLAGFLNAGTANYRRPGGDIFGFAGTGTFAEEVVLSAPCAVPIPDDVPFEIAALIGCGVTTGIGAALNTAKVPVRRSPSSAAAASASAPSRAHGRPAPPRSSPSIRCSRGATPPCGSGRPMLLLRRSSPT